MRTAIKIIVPIIIIILGVLVVKIQMNNRPEPKKVQKKKITPIVMTAPAELVEGYRYQISAYGTVQPAKSVEIVSEVSGKVIWQSEKLKTGGMFRKGEGMYRVDDTAYVAALDARLSSLKSAELELQKVMEQAEISRREWEIWNEAGGVKKPSALVSYEPQMRSAEAAVQSAKSAVVSAESDLAKVMYKAPFDCVVTAEKIEHGKIIRVGESAGTLVGTESYEVYLPVSAKDAVRLIFSVDKAEASDGYVELVEGRDSWRWSVYAERVLPDADSKTGMLQAVLRVMNPFDTAGGRPIMPIGASVRAVVNERDTHDMVRIPDESLREGNTVWVLSDDRVQIRDVKVTEKRDEYVYVSRGLIGGESVITSTLVGVVDGMKVNTGEESADEPQKKKGGKAGGGK